MSPFSKFLKACRLRRGLRQKQLALILGYEPSYLSALERGGKGPPRKDFIERLKRGLVLSEEEQKTLHQALLTSRRQFSIPHRATDVEFEMVHRLVPQLGSLLPQQIQLIQLALSIPQICRDIPR